MLDNERSAPFFQLQFDAETYYAVHKNLNHLSPHELTPVIQKAYVDREIIRVVGGFLVVLKNE
jgi:hypothetical protein